MVTGFSGPAGKSKGGTMDCPKCEGLMISERMTDFSLVFYAWRCVNCGTIMDGTILKNKKKPTDPIPDRCSMNLRKTG